MEEENWVVEELKCDLCGFEAVHVYPDNCEKLECSNCGNMSSHFPIGDLEY